MNFLDKFYEVQDGEFKITVTVISLGAQDGWEKIIDERIHKRIYKRMQTLEKTEGKTNNGLFASSASPQEI